MAKDVFGRCFSETNGACVGRDKYLRGGPSVGVLEG